MISAAERIKIVLGRRKMSIGDLAELIGTSRQNLSNKFSRNNLTEKDIQMIATALDCTYDISFVMNDTGERI